MHQFFTTPQLVALTTQHKRRAWAFAKKVAATTNYADSRQGNARKITEDHYVSKLGEEAVCLVCAELKLTVQGPDYTIYEGKQKSWEHDLYVNGTGLAVKTQRATAAKRYGLSWTFQAAPRHDPILDLPEAWVCFVELDDTTYHCRVFPLQQIKNLIFGEPRLAKLRGLKKMVYLHENPHFLAS